MCVCFCRHGTHAATAAAATAGLPHGSCHAAEHARHDGNELWGADAPRGHANAGEICDDCVVFMCHCDSLFVHLFVFLGEIVLFCPFFHL